jgi:hypothetical protein
MMDTPTKLSVIRKDVVLSRASPTLFLKLSENRAAEVELTTGRLCKLNS